MRLIKKIGLIVVSVIATIALTIWLYLLMGPHVRIWFHKPMNISDADVSKSMVGIWQAQNVVASVWDTVYQFFPDGRFVFNYSQMICENREPRFSGTWKINKGILELSVIQQDVIEGGRIVPSVGSCDTMIEGGHIIHLKVNPPKQIRYALSDFRLDKGINLVREPYQLLAIHIDGTPYWKFRDDPNEYE